MKRHAVMCQICECMGYTNADYNLYTCNGTNGCNRSLGRKNFEEKMLKNAKTRGATLLCKECLLKEAQSKGVNTEEIECCQPTCRKSHFDLKWTKQRRKDLRTGHSKSLCPECERKGYTTRDTNTYKCDKLGCQFEGGVSQFTKESMAKYKKRSCKGIKTCLKCG
jgi:hypothetical protein